MGVVTKFASLRENQYNARRGGQTYPQAKTTLAHQKRGLELRTHAKAIRRISISPISHSSYSRACRGLTARASCAIPQLFPIS